MRATRTAHLTRPLSQTQLDRPALMRARALARLEQLAIEAPADTKNVIGRPARRSEEVKRLQRRVPGVSERWAPRWTADAAAAPGAVVNLEHVVPVIVLTERILQGNSGAVRIELVDEIADLASSGQGQWSELGTISLGSHVVACDPSASSIPTTCGTWRTRPAATKSTCSEPTPVYSGSG